MNNGRLLASLRFQYFSSRTSRESPSPTLRSLLARPLKCIRPLHISTPFFLPTKAEYVRPARLRNSSNSSPIKAQYQPRRIPQLPVSAINEIFHPGFDPHIAGQVVFELHKRRVTGSIVDDGIRLDNITFSKQDNEEDATAHPVSPEQAGRVLDWLRRYYPVDESAAAARYAERELDAYQEQISKRFLAQATRYGLLKTEGQQPGRQKIRYRGKPAVSNDTNTPDSPIEEGSFIIEKVQKWNKKREVQETARKELQIKALQLHEAKNQKFALKLQQKQELMDEQREEKLARWKRMEEESRLDDAEVMDQERSAVSRLARPTIFALAVMGLAAGGAMLLSGLTHEDEPATVAATDTKTKTNWDAVITCSALTALHMALFLAWKRPEMWWYMNRYFMLSAGASRSFSVLGAVASHQYLYWHLVSNTAYLFIVGIPLQEEIGRWNFLAVYLISGVFGNLATLYWHVLCRNFIHASSGASGALYGIIGTYLWVKPELSLTVPLVDEPVKVSTWYAIGASILLLAVAIRNKTMDHAVHIGGFAAGMVSGWGLNLFKGPESKVDDM